jgi:hypothetical protein
MAREEVEGSSASGRESVDRQEGASQWEAPSAFVAASRLGHVECSGARAEALTGP